MVEKLYTILNLLTMGLFSGLLTDWGDNKGPLPKICLTYPTVMALVMPYPKKIQKKYKSLDTPREFC